MLKTKKGVAKRFKLTKKGKVKHTVCGKSHLLSSKSQGRLRRMKRQCILTGSKERKFIKTMLPYG
jgi:large subunit ribosomal protein L35